MSTFKVPESLKMAIELNRPNCKVEIQDSGGVFAAKCADEVVVSTGCRAYGQVEVTEWGVTLGGCPLSHGGWVTSTSRFHGTVTD